MVGVGDSSVDLVFAGQTTEHLWSYELSGFLEEAHRVLRADGLLVLDSPNRLVTEHLLWSHGGHTVELSVAEITELVTLAGFEVFSTAGIWRCHVEGRRWQLEEGLDDPAIFTRRAATAHDAPDDSFVWWINARRTDSPPDSPRLRARTKELFETHWNTRVCRGLFPAPGANVRVIERGHVGLVGATLPFPLKPGPFELKASLLSGSWDDLDGFRIDIVAPIDQVVHQFTADGATRSGAELRWTFDQPYLLFATTIEVHVDHVRSPVGLALPLELICEV
jgi:hypothetical protein